MTHPVDWMKHVPQAFRARLPPQQSLWQQPPDNSHLAPSRPTQPHNWCFLKHQSQKDSERKCLGLPSLWTTCVGNAR